MSSKDIAVSVRDVSKAYRIAHGAPRHTTAGEAIAHRLRNPLQRIARKTFWALQDISFDVFKGDVVGIIGRNGAGKSTLLKILSQITEPTTGEIRLYGRVGSLLEVGTGFHPELTGRENIFLNGAILGMRKTEIARQFDAIVDFAEIEQFLDTPVKRYSSGMYVRLAFAVAAHLNPEILIVDEVLAVGDAQFQAKCLGKMQDVAQKEGRTVLFVSHNMAAVSNLCTKAILLSKGTVKAEGETQRIVANYLEQAEIMDSSVPALSDLRNRSGSGKIRITGFSIEDQEGNKIHNLSNGMDVTFVFDYQAFSDNPLKQVDVGLSVKNSQEQTVFVLYSSYTGVTFASVPREGKFRCRINRFPLFVGRYSVGGRVVVNGEEADWPRSSIGSFNVEAGDFYGTGTPGFGGSSAILMDGDWDITAKDDQVAPNNAGDDTQEKRFDFAGR